MGWKFDPFLGDLVFTVGTGEFIDGANITFGSNGSDMAIDTGERTNDGSTLDQGQRVNEASV
jgi:hypothetical protein